PKRNDRKEDKSIVMTLRMDRELQERFDVLAAKSDRSRNELMCMALKYALEHLEFIDSDKENIDS
ncbi:ribbon-helix-helix protein, CopG family, partial [Allofournierella sp.]